ncbi:Gfo/Idh/MocA family oxidoreductase [Geodermatophilus sp. YIM 151500]|uniref:Gfo/Idh/MocA family protein n=1 Tax=Geodermatophilus sp. YIM 151500 TaxID=2984531 RepID=UPI0021E4D3A7|nr:Gfo/Idh/MocA family oxidoreductase [Geodermatophilus sp. YIM 151500]MCV2490293.1 Gfo/Idh/MocA family oxidoreductase [Geodermatophilus sp. YIM 151500]
MTQSPVRIGLVGYGFGGRLFHAPLIEHAEGCELAVVVVRSEERRADLARDRPGVPAVAGLSELAAAGVDAVVLTTPLETHVPLVLEAVGLGLPVVSDKPFAPEAASARTAVDAAERASVLLTVYQNRRWDADYLTVRDVVASGHLGEVLSFESRMEQRLPPGGLPRTGGGALLDLGSHAVDQALTQFGPVRSVYAELRLLPDGLDDRFFLALRHEDGVRSHVTGSWASRGEPSNRFRVVGSNATYAAPDDDGQTERLLEGRTPASDGASWGTVPESGGGQAAPRRRERTRAGAGGLVEHLLLGARPGRPRRGAAAGRPPGRRRRPRRARRGPALRHHRSGGRAAGPGSALIPRDRSHAALV